MATQFLTVCVLQEAQHSVDEKGGGGAISVFMFVFLLNNHIFKKKISSSSELLSNNSLSGGQLQRRSNHERAARVIHLHTYDRQTVNYYSTIHALELIYFNSNTQ